MPWWRKGSRSTENPESAKTHDSRTSRAVFSWFGREDQILLFLALVIGGLTGVLVAAFILLTEHLGMKLYPVGSPAWHRIVVPVAGSLGIGYLLYRYFPDARGSGVPQTKAALFARGGVITGSTIFGKFFCTAVTLASGIPLGREGPAVQVGGGIASVLGRRLGLRQEKVKALLPVGAAAAIAAAFNTPMAAVLFALEEIMGDLNAPVLGSVVLASVTSCVALRSILGNSPLFKVPEYQLVNPAEFAIYAVLGVAGGFVSAAFTRSLLAMRAWFLTRPRWTFWFQPVCGGLLVGLMGIFVPQVMGVGYGYVGQALNGSMTLELMAMLVVLKLAGATVSYASGNAGGIFGPSLFIGAMLGGTIGSIAHHFLPAYTAVPGAYALVGMGTAFAGIVRAPMTSVMMIFETTRDYTVIVPLMISNLISFFISARLQHESIYAALALQDGIHLPTADTRLKRKMPLVQQAMTGATELLSADKTVEDALEATQSSQLPGWPVMRKDTVIGVISRKGLEEAADRGEGGKPLGDLFRSLDFPHVHADQGLDFAMERMGVAGVDLLPVVSRADIHHLEGVVTLNEVLCAFGVSQGPLSRAVERAVKASD